MKQKPHTDRPVYEQHRPAPPLRLSVAFTVAPLAIMTAAVFPRLALAFLVGTTLGVVWERR